MRPPRATTAATVVALLAVAVPCTTTPLHATNPLTPSQPQPLRLRALPANAPHGYAPQTNPCPSAAPAIRVASSLSPEESAWLPVRRNATVTPMSDFLSRLNITGFDAASYIAGHSHNASALPNIGIAVSGGGYRAMLTGAGVLEAFDSRTTNSTNTGQLGGLLQSATYLAGLSGGSWLVGSLYANNFTSVDAILAGDTDADDSGDVWQLGNSIFEGPDAAHLQSLHSASYYASLVSQVGDKKDAGFNATITDYWGRALSYQMINATDGGPDFTFSSIADQDWFTSGTAPLPLIVTDGRAPGQVVVSQNSTLYVFSPWELGSDDPTVFGFAPLKYVGTNFSSGSVADTNACVTGFDNVGYVFGTSSTLFNSALTTINGTNSTGLFSSALQDAIEAILGAVGEADEDIADYPNPFVGFHASTNSNARDPQLTLVDGGEDGQNIPLTPLIQPDRHVDVIFAVDSSADTTASIPANGSAANWPIGAALISTYERSLVPIANGTAFPAVPDQNSFVNLGLNNRPTFFGCDSTNQTSSGGQPAPLVVYLPNAPYVYTSNVSTFDLQYNDTERNAIVLNGYHLATQSNGTIDPQWPTCVGCAILSRSWSRTGTSVPSVCRDCFQSYCWNGTTDSTAPNPYVPTMKGTQVKVTSGAAGAPSVRSLIAALGSAGLVAAAVMGM